MNKIALILTFFTIFACGGCASVPMESEEISNTAKEFSLPQDGNAGLYIYRSGSFGGALKKDIFVDEKCIGESAPNVFFYEEVPANNRYIIATESEFSPNKLIVDTDSGKNYFIQQYMKIGIFVGGANVKLVDEEEGKLAVRKLSMAKSGICSG